MPLRNPPPSVPVRTFPSPKLTDQVLIEWVNNELGNYTPIDIGSPHPNQREFAGFILGAQKQNPTDHNFIQRIWVTDQTSPDAYNYALKFSSEDDSFPAFIRTYREPKSTYTPRVKGSALGALYKLVVDNVGTGYSNGELPPVTFAIQSPPPTSVAIAHGVVAADGSVPECVLDFCGEGYTENVTFTVEAPINGTPASGTAYVQPTTAILVKEEANQYPEDSEFYAQYLQVIRVYETLPGPTLISTKLDDKDGVLVTMYTTRKLCADIVTEEDITTGVWTKTVKKETDIDFVCEEITTKRAIPGFPMQSTKTDPDGIVVNRTQTYTATADCVTEETLVGTTWTHKYLEDVDGTTLVSWQWVETRQVNTDNVIPSATVSEDEELSTTTKELKDQSLITPGTTYLSGLTVVITEKEAVSDLVSYEVVTTKDELDRAVFSVRIPESIIPVEFRAAIPTVTEVHIVAGTAAMPTLAAGEFFREELQYKKLLKRVTVESLGGLSFPITQTGTETSSEYGGAVLDIVRTLDDTLLTADEGEDIVASYVNPIGASLMWFKETKKRPVSDAVWPTLTEYDQEPETQALITTTYQVVDASSVVAPSIVNGVITRYKRIDKWRSIQIVETYSLPADYDEQRFMAHTFPSLWDWTTYNYSTACGATGPIRHGFATMVQARLAIYFTTSKQTITGLTLIPNTHHLVHDIVAGVLNDAGTITYVGTCSGPVTLPASSPDYSTYIGTIQGTEQLISGESVLWRAGLYKNSGLYITMI